MSFLSVAEARRTQMIMTPRNIRTLVPRRRRGQASGSSTKHCPSFLGTSVPAAVLSSLPEFTLGGVLVVRMVEVQEQRVRATEGLAKVCSGA